jgi:Tol biopolymer transport system component
MKRLLLLVTVVAFAGAAPGTGVGPAATAVDRTVSSTDGAIVFASDRDGDADLYAVNADGTGLARLTNERSDEYDPLPSPDGKHILFRGGDGLQVLDVDGGGRRSLHDCVVSPGAWSPDSRHLVCSSQEGVIILDTAGGTFTQLTDRGYWLVWSPDGTTIAFVDENKLYVIPATGGSRVHLGMRKVADYAAPAWSPDSQSLAYVSVESGSREFLSTIGADGSGGRRLAKNASASTPSWSPDGSRIAFARDLPHYVTAVYTVLKDGTGLHLVSGSSGGEYAQHPAWSGDGQIVLYERTRFRYSEQSDIYAVSPIGRGGRALTNPFPAGGTNTAPRWMTGLHASGSEQLPPTMAVPFKRKTSFGDPILSIATDGIHAVPTLSAEVHPALTVWNGATGRARRGPTPCPMSGPNQVALARDRIAWTCTEAGNTYYVTQLITAHVGDRRAKSVASAEGSQEGGDDIWGPVGHGGTIAFSLHHGGDHGPNDPWLVLTKKAAKCPDSEYYNSRAVCRPLGRQRGLPMAVDGGRVVTVTATGIVRLLSLRGRVLHAWTIGERVVTASLRGRVLAVQHGSTLDAYDAKTGAKRRSRELQTDGGPPPFLLGAQGDLAVYETGGAIHVLRLSDGRDKALRLPGAAPALYASLEPAGLFVSWNKMHDRRPGRIGFIPLRAIAAGL